MHIVRDISHLYVTSRYSTELILLSEEELSRWIEEERAAIHAEYEQERIAYQKLLKDYNRQVRYRIIILDGAMFQHYNT